MKKEYKHATFDYENQKYVTVIENPNFVDYEKILQLNTPYYIEMLQQENIYDDFVSYMKEKRTYNKNIKEYNIIKQEAFELAIKENSDLLYEDFESSFETSSLENPYDLKEPQPSDNIKNFIKEYLE